MKWLLVCFVLFSTLNQLRARELPISVNAEAVILIDAKTGLVLYQKNAHEKMFPASTTKIATTLYALHLASDQLERKMTATQDAIASITPQAKKQSNYRSPSHWLETDGTHVGIKKGETFVFRDLLYAIMLASANDASNVVAQNLGGTIPKFMDGLNKFLKDLGCKHTTFNNPHGLHHPGHATTAFDLATLAKIAMKNPLFREIVSTVRYKCPKTNLEEERTFVQGNRLLRSGAFHYDKAIGVKTGYTSNAGKNLVAAAEDGNRSLIAVVFAHQGSRDDLYREVIQMFESAFQEKKMRRILLQSGEQRLTKLIKGAKGELKTHLLEPLYYDFYPSEEFPVKVSVVWDTLSLPLSKGQKVGAVKLLDDKEQPLLERALFSSVDLKATFWSSLFQQKKGRQILFYVAAGSFLLGFLALRRKAR